MELKYNKIQTTGTDTPLKIVKGHFATNHAHTNYYFDLTTVKSRLSEAGGIAQALVHMYLYDMIVDTIVCMEGTEVIGTLLAQELTKGGFMSKNAHKTIYVIKPEFNSNSQIVFKDNYRAMINGKNVLNGLVSMCIVTHIHNCHFTDFLSVIRPQNKYISDIVQFFKSQCP